MHQQRVRMPLTPWPPMLQRTLPAQHHHLTPQLLLQPQVPGLDQRLKSWGRPSDPAWPAAEFPDKTKPGPLPPPATHGLQLAHWQPALGHMRTRWSHLHAGIGADGGASLRTHPQLRAMASPHLAIAVGSFDPSKSRQHGRQQGGRQRFGQSLHAPNDGRPGYGPDSGIGHHSTLHKREVTAGGGGL